ncbi:hypothetical protein EJB05_40301 [Eragrostis curvula]|uniref:1-phosphatidylinositol-3-phosphate 5-kinase n=1 Tax=Eragrostis curvula TaxID=38414 RepID=A0A5J9TZB2_9POAL|nr:hypothetical protein EJB05_40301 [Eragrostis curvula]
MPAMILLHKREDDANRNHQDPPSENGVPFLPKAHERSSIVKSDGVGGTANEDDDAIWIPPEAAEMDDDEADHVACSSSSTGSIGDWGREERHNAMLQAMNGQLRILAARFLASAGISFPLHDDDSSWLDIVTSLSWEAALLIKPDGAVGEEMDPGSYIKVKCVASGTRRQCEVIKGLVFKKSAAHKHMPTSCHNPRLLLLRGVLGDSHDGFSSFSSMEQEKDHLQKSVGKMMEMCSPNVIMVEKTVSRDIQELLLKEGVTLVLDMKLSRLQRIARSSGSPILSFSEVPSKPKLKQCDFFHIEKIMEEHNHITQVGKRTSKTLMFLEGFHKPSGCTILLRGANSEELKKVKQVMYYTVFAAYHLVLETSFFEDQRVFLNNKNASKEANSFRANSGQSEVHHETPALPNDSLLVSPEDNDASPLKLYPETCNGSVEKPTDREINIISSTYPVALSSLNKGVPEATDEVFRSERLASSVSGSRKRFIDMFCHQNIYLPFTSAYEATHHQEEGSLENSQEGEGNASRISPKEGVPVASGENVDNSSDSQKQASSENDHQTTLNDPSVSEKHEQSSIPLENEKHHITGNISGDRTSGTDEGDDVLESQSILILMSSQCITKEIVCEQSHLFRIKYYGNFDVSLGRYLQDILQSQNLSCSSCGEPPEAHMYSYTHRNGNLTVFVKRLLPRYHLPGESEGNIWMWTRCLRCEHESGISKSSRRVLISSEARNLSFGKFLELSFSSHSAARRLSICGHLVNRDCLRFFGLGSKVAMFQYSSVEIYTACKPQPTLEFHNPNTQEWYEQERRNVLARGVMLFSEVRRFLLNMKDQFHGLAINRGAFLPIKEFSQLEEMLIKEKSEFMDSVTKAVGWSGTHSSVHEILDVNWLYQDLLLELYVWDRRLYQLLDCKSAEIEIMGNNIERETSESTGDQTAAVAERASSKPSLGNEPIEPEKVNDSGETWVDEKPWHEEQHSTNVSSSDMSLKQQFRLFQLDDREKWVWNPLCESRLAYRQELQVGVLEKFELVNHYSPSHLSPLHKQSVEEVSSAQFIVGPGGNVLRVSEDEISSIISRALAVSEERRQLLDAIIESQAADIRGRERTKTMDKSCSSVSETSASSSSSWSSIGSSDSEASFASDDLSSYDSSLLSSSLHPEIPVNGKNTLKGKYSVICVHSDQFYTLRKKCCPSELAYITSLSRCKRWDAQGGKSKAFFAKTMDDRFIIKQIKKTEFESFIEFAPDYFKHVCHSLDTGSQTCLAKILGIYQVKQLRHGKEVKIDLMVMENILFGHNVSRTYDLKGVVFARHVSDSNEHDTVYLDQNFVEDMRVSPIYICGRTKHLLQRAIWNDTSFLTSINVMDYSLLVGVDKQKHEFVFGIIDYLRQYTWDKQLETWVKTSLVVPKNSSPTVISPREYKKRFRKFMAKYFLTVPDDWSTENRMVSCKSCAHTNSKLLPVHDEKPQHQIVACA